MIHVDQSAGYMVWEAPPHVDMKCSERTSLAVQWCVAWVLAVGFAVATQGAYRVDLTSDGTNRVALRTGDTFDLDVILSSDAADTHGSMELRLSVSCPGLVLESAQWEPPYFGGGEDDASTPTARELPTVLSEATLEGRGLPMDEVDLYLSNALQPPVTFSTGRMARLKFRVPEGFAGPELVTIRALSPSFGMGFTALPAVSGAPFQLTVEGGAQGTVPILTVVGEEGGVVLSWPAAVRDAVLEISNDCTNDALWRTAGGPLETQQDRKRYFIPRLDLEASAFFRIRLQPR